MRLLYHAKEQINPIIKMCGGDTLSIEADDCWHWTSTKVAGQQTAKAWLFSMSSGAIHDTPKTQAHQVRPIITINNWIMTMNGVNDFKIPQYMDIAHPNRGFFGYLLRCRCLRAEEFYGDFIFLDDGIDCFKKFPTVRKRREEMRVEWTHQPLSGYFSKSALLCQRRIGSKLLWFHDLRSWRWSTNIPWEIYGGGTCLCIT